MNKQRYETYILHQILNFFLNKYPKLSRIEDSGLPSRIASV